MLNGLIVLGGLVLIALLPTAFGLKLNPHDTASAGQRQSLANVVWAAVTRCDLGRTQQVPCASKKPARGMAGLSRRAR